MRDEFFDGVNFFLRETGWLRTSADKTGDALGGTNSQPGVVIDLHANEKVAGENLFLDGRFFTLIDFDFFLSGNENLFDEVIKT